MSRPREQGFTLIEIMIALVLLVVGVMALAGSSAMVTRMIGQGRASTLVGQLAGSRAEWLRQLAASTSPACGSAMLRSGSSNSGGVAEEWTVLGAAGEPLREARLTYAYRVPRGIRSDTVSLTLLCR